MVKKNYDHVIVGTGQSTGTLLGRLIPTGDSIAVIEADKVGGSCVNYGCTPTKALVASAKAFYQAGRGEEFGFSSSDLKLDFSRVRERMNEVRGSASDGFTTWMESEETVDLIRGWASFKSDYTLKVGDDEITGKKIYINTGTRPAAPPITGLDKVNWLDSAGLLDLTAVPRHLLVIGGGYIGVEFAQVYRRFGAEVTILQRGDRMMPREDEEVSTAIQDFLEEEGIRIICEADIKSVLEQSGSIQIELNQKGEGMTIQGSHLLIAAGRLPNSYQLGLENTAIEKNAGGYIRVNEHCETTVENVFAVGDVNGHGAFTHTSVNDAEIVLDYLFGGNRKLSTRTLVYALFSDPPLGRVGMSEKEALKKGYKILKATKPMAEISRAKEMSEKKGFAKIIVDAETDLLLGTAILGVGGDEVINMFAAIIHSQIPCRSYREVVLVHPTISELMPWVLDGLQPVN